MGKMVYLLLQQHVCMNIKSHLPVFFVLLKNSVS